MGNPVKYLFHLIAGQLSKFGFIDVERGRRIADLVWPRFLTMLARDLYRVADIAMVGVAVGPAAIAGLAFASIFWGFANAFSLGLAGGTISLVSQRFGAERFQRLDLAVKQSVWIGITIALPFIAVYWFYSEPLVGIVSNDPASTELGGQYLRILAVALVFNELNHVSSRTLAGADDTWIAMSVRATGAFLNIILNALFIFALGMGVEGAALGTIIAEGVVTAAFTWGFIGGTLPFIGPFPVTITLGRPFFDARLSKQLLTITPPLIAQSLARTFARFPLYAILAIFGPTVVAAFEIARRIRRLMGSTGAGFSMAASGLVGQELGRNDGIGADGYARDAIRYSSTVYLLTAIVVVVLAVPISHVFTDDPETISRTVPFVRIAAVSFVAMGMTSTFSGILKAAGDNNWILFGQLVGQYLVLIPLTYLGTVTPLGITAVYLGILCDPLCKAAITGRRFASGKWKTRSGIDHSSATTD